MLHWRTILSICLLSLGITLRSAYHSHDADAGLFIAWVSLLAGIVLMAKPALTFFRSELRGTPLSGPESVTREEAMDWLCKTASVDDLFDLAAVKFMAMESGMPHNLAFAHAVMTSYLAKAIQNDRTSTARDIIINAKKQIFSTPSLRSRFEKMMKSATPDAPRP